MNSVLQTITKRKELLLLAAMLELLHFAIWLDFGTALTRSLMLMHLGLFLIWQPVWRGDARVAWYNGLLFILLTGVFVILMNPWLLAGWLLLLTGMCGGRIVITRNQRYVYMLALVFLVCELLIACTAMLFDIDIPPGVTGFFRVLLPALPAVMLLLPSEPEDRSVTSVDIVYASVTMLLLSLLIVGSLLNMYMNNTDYITALVQSLIAIGFLLFLISWLLSPRAGFSGFSQIWLQSILNIGTPFEQWLTAIDSHFERESTPDEFIEAAAWELVSLPWISGVQWQTPNTNGEYGQFTKYVTKIETDQIAVSIHGYNTISGSLYLHCKLLVQIIHNLYVAKVRERALLQQTHIQAVHETGARVTHDIKNLLQSLQAITSIIRNEDDYGYSHVSQQVLKKQLPNLTQRLQLALDKLQAPHEEPSEEVYLKDWWGDIQKRTSLANVHYQEDISGDPVIPADLFDSVMDNLIDNLREKLQAEPDIQITVSLLAGSDHIQLMICDTGSRIPQEKARRMFNELLESDTGLGIGLFQAASHAKSLGYDLRLSNNQDGKVCFELANNN